MLLRIGLVIDIWLTTWNLGKIEPVKDFHTLFPLPQIVRLATDDVPLVAIQDFYQFSTVVVTHVEKLVTWVYWGWRQATIKINSRHKLSPIQKILF